MRNTKLILLAASLFLFLACTKDKPLEVEAIVEAKAGCFADSWRVTLVSPDPKRHKFLCEPPVTMSSIPDCSHKVFIRLPADLAIPGKHIIFSGVTTEPSCLSSSVAPAHINVAKLRGN